MLPLGGARQRSLLALLLLHANESVSRERLIAGVWGGERPTTFGATLNVHLSKIRKLLAAAGTDATLVTELNGYVLRIDPERLDVHRFEQRVREGRQALVAGRSEEAAATLDRALVLWRGPPLAELELHASVDAAVGRLGELRLSALEDRFEAGLLVGRHTELAAELEEFVREHPLRERARAQLMISLYRSGRQSEALHAYRDVRLLLADELGLDPGPELQRLEKAILVQDPALIPREPRRLLQTRRARRPAFVIGVALAAGALLAVGRGEPGTRTTEPLAEVVLAHASDVAVIRPDTSEVVARVRVGSSPALIREGGGSVWVADRLDLTVTEIDLESRRVLRTVGVGFRPDDLAARDDTVWAFDKEERVLARLGEEQTWDRFEHPDFTEVERIAVDDHAVWLAGGKRLIRVDPTSGAVVGNVSMPAQVDGVAAAGDDVWAVSSAAASVLRVDPRTAEIKSRISMARDSGPQALTISADTDFIWVLNGDSATVVKIDPSLHDVVETYRLGLGRGSLALAAGEGAAWISNAFDGTVTRIDGRTNEVASIAVSAYSSPKDVTFAGGLVWVSVADDRAPR
ncbi:MAG TPA: BTAD domain-containing putative transcriptional regulator [Gaiellaceae bacterium]|nr:BTAD domain-containing putative transcriptional regulator [Gaiellaceae bacterium]